MRREDLIPTARAADLLRAASVGDPTVYEAYSAPDALTKVFIDEHALVAHVSALRASCRKFFDFSFHFPEVGGEVSTVRFALQPEKCGGATCREKTQGWGLINIQITDQPGAVSKCSVSVNSEKRAYAWAETLKELGDPERWDWKAVDRQASRIIRVSDLHHGSGHHRSEIAFPDASKPPARPVTIRASGGRKAKFCSRREPRACSPPKK